jgi:hypothetical protein
MMGQCVKVDSVETRPPRPVTLDDCRNYSQWKQGVATFEDASDITRFAQACDHPAPVVVTDTTTSSGWGPTVGPINLPPKECGWREVNGIWHCTDTPVAAPAAVAAPAGIDAPAVSKSKECRRRGGDYTRCMRS